MKDKLNKAFENFKKIGLVLWQKLQVLLAGLKKSMSIFKMKKISDYKGIRDFIAQWWHRILLIFVIFIALYYPVGGALISNIDDNINYRIEENVISGGSMTVAAVASLVDREVNEKTWTANLPIIFPSYFLDNMPNFQMGIISSLSRFTTELAEQIGRTRGGSMIDADLEKASGLLKYSGKIWFIDSSTSFMPTASSNKQYRAAREKLLDYNERLANGEAVFEIRVDNLIIVLDRISKDLGSMSAEIDNQVEIGSNKFIDLKADDVFYNVKGKIYGYTIMLRYLGSDFKTIIEDKNLNNLWFEMIESLEKAAVFKPRVIMNGKPDDMFIASHLSVQGFYLLRARTKIQEVANVLTK